MKNMVQIAAFAIAVLLVLPVFQVFRVKAEANAWVAKAPMLTPRAYLGAAVVNDRIYAIGGSNGPQVNEEYYPATNTWTTKKPMPTGRSSFGIAVHANKIYCIGGRGTDGISGANEIYDPATDTWKSGAQMPTPRYGLKANVVNGKIYLIGGIRDQTTGELSNLNEVYDPNTDTWSTKAPIPDPTYNYASAVVDNKIYVMGWKTWIYNPAIDTWNYGTPAPYGGGGAGATIVETTKRIYCIVSGEASSSEVININQVYDPVEDSWAIGFSMPTSRFYFALAPVKDRLYAIGGLPVITFSPNQPFSAENEEYTPTLDVLRPINDTDLPIDAAAPEIVVLLPKNRTYEALDIQLNFTVNRQVSLMVYSLDAQDNVTIAGNTTLTGLSKGSHKLTVYATDISGKAGASETIYFTIAGEPELLATAWIAAAIVSVVIVGTGFLI